MDALAAQGISRGRQRAGEGLALTGFHLHDVLGEQPHGAQYLDVERPLAEGAPRCFAAKGTYLDQLRVAERRRVAKLACTLCQFLVGELFELRFEVRDRGQQFFVVGQLDAARPLDDPAEPLAHPADHCCHPWSPVLSRRRP